MASVHPFMVYCALKAKLGDDLAVRIVILGFVHVDIIAVLAIVCSNGSQPRIYELFDNLQLSLRVLELLSFLFLSLLHDESLSLLFEQ